MGGGWMGSGWGSMDSAWENVGSGDRGPRRTWMPPEATNRLLFLEDDPTTLWEHNFKWNKHWRNWEPCVTRNKLGPVCPPCDAWEDRYPYFAGLSTVINMTAWFTKQGNIEVCFQREIFAAKLGSDEKPGVLKKLRKMYEKNGRLRGYVYDVERPGKKTESCGSEFDLVEIIEAEEIKTYGMDQLAAYANRLNENAEKDKQTTPEKLWKRNPWEAHNFEEIVKPRPIEELQKMFSSAGGAGADNNAPPPHEDADNAGVDDDIPY